MSKQPALPSGFTRPVPPMQQRQSLGAKRPSPPPGPLLPGALVAQIRARQPSSIEEEMISPVRVQRGRESASFSFAVAEKILRKSNARQEPHSDDEAMTPILPIVPIASVGKAPPPPLPPTGKAAGPPLPKGKAAPPLPSVGPSGVKKAVTALQQQPKSNLPALRPLFWSSVQPRDESVWDQISKIPNKPAMFNEQKIFQLFAATTTNPPPKKMTNPLPPPSSQGNSGASAPNKKHKPIAPVGESRILKVLDNQKSQNLEIAFKKFPPAETIFDSILSGNVHALTGDQLKLLA